MPSGWIEGVRAIRVLVALLFAAYNLVPLGLVALAGGISRRGKRGARAGVALTISARLFVLVLLLEGVRRCSEMTDG
jgi:hypothetical protein